jgi:hypothetical protein
MNPIVVGSTVHWDIDSSTPQAIEPVKVEMLIYKVVQLMGQVKLNENYSRNSHEPV